MYWFIHDLDKIVRESRSRENPYYLEPYAKEYYNWLEMLDSEKRFLLAWLNAEKSFTKEIRPRFNRAINRWKKE